MQAYVTNFMKTYAQAHIALYILGYLLGFVRTRPHLESSSCSLEVH